MTPPPLGPYCTVLYPVQVIKAQVTGTYNLIPPSTGQNKRKLIAARFPQVWWSHTPQQQASETGTARVDRVSEHSLFSLTKAHPASADYSCSCRTMKLGWSTLVDIRVFVPIPVPTVHARLDAKVDSHDWWVADFVDSWHYPQRHMCWCRRVPQDSHRRCVCCSLRGSHPTSSRKRSSRRSQGRCGLCWSV